MGKIQECWDFLKSQKVNKKMIPIKAFGAFVNMGTMAIFPFLTIQMTEMGLTYSDVSIVYGLIPAFTCLSGPISGYIGDRIGYRIVLVVNLIIAGLTATSFDWTPRFVEHYRTPTISFNTTSDIPEVLQFQWAPNDCNMNNITVDYCENDEILLNEDFWLNLDVFSNCSMTNSSLVALEDIPEFLSFEVIDLKRNGTLCLAKTSNKSWEDNETFDLTLCNLDKYGADFNITECYDSEGSHQKTFWIYFAKRMLFQMALISIYSCLDGTALRHVREFNSDYAWVTFYSTVANIIAPLVASLLIIDPPEGSDEETDYSRNFYFFDALMIAALLVSLVLKVNVGKEAPEDDKKSNEKEKKREHRKAVKQLFTPSALIFFLMLVSSGLSWGIKDTFLYVYLSEEMKASSKLLSYTSAISVGSGLLILPFSKWISEKIGHMHVLYFTIMVQMVQGLFAVVIKQTPPTFIYGLAVFDSFGYTLFWITAMTYSYKLAPPTLIGTMAAMAGSVEWVISKGSSSLIGGQILDYGISKTNLFIYTSIICSIWATVCYLIYILFGRRIEKELIEKNEAKRLELEGQKSQSQNNSDEFKLSPDHGKDDPDTMMDRFSITQF